MLQVPLPATPAAEPAGLITRWRERWRQWRDGLLTSPDFQRRAARTWWMRPIAKMKAT